MTMKKIRVQWSFEDRVKLFRDFMAHMDGSSDTLPESWSYYDEIDFYNGWMRKNKPVEYAIRLNNPQVYTTGPGAPARVEIGRVFEFGIMSGSRNLKLSHDHITNRHSQVCARILSLAAALEVGFIRPCSLPDFIWADWNLGFRNAKKQSSRVRAHGRKTRKKGS
jgi:hypothetical protein